MLSHRLLVLILAVPLFLAAQAAPQAGRAGRVVQPNAAGPRVDMKTYVRTIDMHDSVWIGELTSAEIRDQLKAGKTTALVLAGGMEENGPWLTMDKHNIVMRVMGEAIARKLGNALCAPILTMEPGNPQKNASPGSVVLSEATYKSLLTDMAESLKTEGFKNIEFLADHGGDQKSINEVSKVLNESWKGSGVKALFIADFYSYDDIEVYKTEKLGIKEVPDGFHDDYKIDAIIMTQDVNGVRIPERIKAHKTTVNGVDLVPVDKVIENGRKIVQYRTEKTVEAIHKLMAAADSPSQQ